LRHLGAKVAKLNFLAKVLKNYIADQCGNDRNREIGGCKNISNGKSQALSLLICMSKFPHQEIGIKQEDYETDLNDCSPKRGQLSRVFRIRIHGLTIAKSLAPLGQNSETALEVFHRRGNTR